MKPFNIIGDWGRIMDKTHTTVHVAGQDLRLSGTDSEAYIRQIADYVNQKIDEVQRAYPSLSTGNCVILAALNLSDELHKLREDYNALDSRKNSGLKRMFSLPVCLRMFFV